MSTFTQSGGDNSILPLNYGLDIMLHAKFVLFSDCLVLINSPLIFVQVHVSIHQHIHVCAHRQTYMFTGSIWSNDSTCTYSITMVTCQWSYPLLNSSPYLHLLSAVSWCVVHIPLILPWCIPVITICVCVCVCACVCACVSWLNAVADPYKVKEGAQK